MNRLRSQEGFGIIGTMIIMVALLALATAAASISITSSGYSQRSYESADALSLAEAGADKGIYAFDNNSSYSGETTTLGAGKFTTSITSIDSSDKYLTSVATITQGSHTYTKRVKVKLSALPNTDGIAFHYAVQVGTGGVQMSNNSKITGTVYSDGNLNGTNGSSVVGDAFVTGPSGTINLPSVTGNAHAHNIQNTTVGGDGYYFSNSTLTNSTIKGTKHPGSTDPASVAFPITAADISNFESDASAGGTQGTISLSGSQTLTVGPKKINGDINLSNNSVLTLTGPIWLTGNISLSNNSIIKLDSSYGANSGVIVADNPTNLSTEGFVNISNGALIQGSGNAKSYTNVISTNTSNSGAINLSNNATNTIFYVPNGFMNLSNNVTLNSATAKGLNLTNNVTITYNSGLATDQIQTGPGGNWTVVSWQEF